MKGVAGSAVAAADPEKIDARFGLVARTSQTASLSGETVAVVSTNSPVIVQPYETVFVCVTIWCDTGMMTTDDDRLFFDSKERSRYHREGGPRITKRKGKAREGGYGVCACVIK